MSTSFKASLAFLGVALILLGLACKKPEPFKTPAAAKVETVTPDNTQAIREDEARRQAEAENERKKLEQARLEAARKADVDSQAAFRLAAEKALQDVHFDFDQAFLSDHEKNTLQGIADFLNHYPKAQIQIEGHCDERGTVEYNLGLGGRRAHTVISYLKGLGIDETRMSTISYGKERPTCTESSESCWSRNRRSHFVLKP